MIFLEMLNPLGMDFTVYYEAAHMFLRGLDPYQGIFSSTFPYNYPPTSVFFIWWLGMLPKFIAGPIWNFASLASLMISIFFLLKLFGQKVTIVPFLVWTILFTLPFFPVKFNIGNGQINLFLLLFAVLSIYLYEKKKLNLSAFFLSFAIGIKFAPAIFVLYFLIKKDYAQIFRIGIWTLVLFLASLIVVPEVLHVEYYSNIFPLSFTLGAKDWYYNQSLEGFLSRSFRTPWIILTLTYIFSAFLILITWIKGQKTDKYRLWSAIACLYLIVHPIALQHYFVFSVIPFILLSLYFRQQKSGILIWVVIIFSYLLIAKDIRNFHLVPPEFRFLLSHMFFGIISLWVLSLWENHSGKILTLIWVIFTLTAYMLHAFCKAKICF